MLAFAESTVVDQPVADEEVWAISRNANGGGEEAIPVPAMESLVNQAWRLMLTVDLRVPIDWSAARYCRFGLSNAK